MLKNGMRWSKMEQDAEKRNEMEQDGLRWNMMEYDWTMERGKTRWNESE